MTALRQFLTELRRRRVVRVLLIYVVAGWAIVQVAATILPSLHVPAWSITLVVVLVALGLPLAAILGWAYEVSDDGLKRTAPTHTEVDTVGALPAASVQPALASVPATPPVPSVTSTSTRRDPIRHSVAVLPFANLTGDATKDFLGHGLAEELIHTLARVPGLRVPARTSSFAYQGRDIDVRRIASELDVGTVLEGSVRAAGERIRITAQLIDGESGYHLWSQHYDRHFEDLFELQDELASAIILQTLNVTQGWEERRLLREPPTRNLEAYRLYLQAMGQQMSDPTGRSLRLAFDMLQRAVKLDPGFAQARAGIVQARSVGLIFALPLPGTLADAEDEAQHVLESAPDSAPTHAALGVIRAAQPRWLDSEASFRQAIALDDSDPEARFWYALYVLGTVGHLHACLAAAREGHRLAPAWMVAHLHLAVAECLVGNDDSTCVHGQAAIDLGIPGTMTPLADVLTNVDLRAGRFEAARTRMQESCMVSLDASREIEAVDLVYAALAGTADRSEAVAALDRLSATPDGGRPFLRRRLIVWYATLGANDQVYELMNRSLDEYAATGTIGLAWSFLWLPELAGVRADPRFGALAERMRLPEYWEHYGPPDGYEWRDNRLIAR